MQLRMIRPDLEHLPELEVPTGFGLRTYQEGDDQHWADIINDSFGGNYLTAADARREIMDQDYFDPRGLFFNTYQQQPVGTACAWRWQRVEETAIGQLHMVGVHSDHTGHRLGRCVSLAVLHYLNQHQYTCAILSTDDFRLPAIKTYLNLGFLPICVDDDHSQRWRTIGPRLGLPPIEDETGQVQANLIDDIFRRVIG